MTTYAPGSTSGGEKDDGVTEKLYVGEESRFFLWRQGWFCGIQRHTELFEGLEVGDIKWLSIQMVYFLNCLRSMGNSLTMAEIRRNRIECTCTLDCNSNI